MMLAWLVFVSTLLTVDCQLVDRFGVRPFRNRQHCFEDGIVCPLTVENVIDIDSNSLVSTVTGCQYLCFRDKSCGNFTFFQNSAGETRCVLFRECEATSDCQRCITGSSSLSKNGCGEQTKLVANNLIKIESRIDEVADEETTTIANFEEFPLPTHEALQGGQEQRLPKQFDEDAEAGNAESGSEEAADELSIEGIDDGLLEEENETPEGSDDSEREEVTPKPGKTALKATPAPKPEVAKPARQPEKQEDYEDIQAFDDDYFDDYPDQGDAEEGAFSNKSSSGYFHCIIGGYGVNGPIPVVSHFGSSLLRRNIPPALAPLPPSFPLGDEGIFSTMHSRSLYVCSPGAASTNDQFFSFFGGPTRALFPGRCVKYDNTTETWEPFGTTMNTFRGGAAFTRMGKFIVVAGGRRFPSTLNTIEVLNTDKPQKWRQLSRLTLPNPTYDHCIVALNKTTIFMTGGFGQESHTMMVNMRTRTSRAMEPMKQPRRQHQCVKAQINGRDGVIVAGGSSDSHPALTSVEFFDLDQRKWLNLGRLREPRRYPSILVMSNHLIVAGGETTDGFGRTVILDTVEALQGRRWIPLKQKLPEGRSRFVTQRIPKSFFF